VQPHREPEAAEQVSFQGLILIRGGSDDGAPQDGKLVLRNADPSGRPLPIELDVRDGRFEGKGPIDAEVAVERLKFGERELATRERTWKLASRWIEIEATCTRMRLLHVIDATSGRELTGVKLGAKVHDEGDPEKLEPGRQRGDPWNASSGFEVPQTRHSSGPAGGFDSPLRLVALDETKDVLIVRAPGYAEERFRFPPDEVEATVAMHAPARLRVQIEPWETPPPDPPKEHRPRPTVVVGLVVDDENESVPQTAEAEETTLLSGLSEGLQSEASRALDLYRRRWLAASTPMMHRMEVDASGVATFEDLCAGTWVAWIEGDESDPRKRTILARNIVRFGTAGCEVIECALEPNPVEFSLAVADERCITLEATNAPSPTCIATLRFIDAKTGEPVVLDASQVGVMPLDCVTSSTSRKLLESSDVLGLKPLSGELVIELPVGVSFIRVDPRLDSPYERAGSIVQIAPGESQLEFRLSRRQGITLVVVVHDVGVDDDLDGLLNSRPILVDGTPMSERATGSEWLYKTRSARIVKACDGLAVGTHAIEIPQGVGFAAPGTREVEVRADDVTIVGLDWTLSAAARAALHPGPGSEKHDD